jgi:homocitrate synthase NifV/benzylmalate synthase
LSDRLLRIKNLTKSQNLRKAISVCKYGKSKGLNILCYGEDATRANRKYVVKFIKGIQRYIDGFVLCDTVGVLTPKKTERFVDYIKNNINCKIGAHFHNDRGLANKNTIAAINHGTEIISGTAGGIGERAGNADWCRILNDLRKEKINTNIYYSELSSLIQFVYKVGGSKPAKPYSSRAFWHESGIHVNALLRDELSYNSFLPKKYGKKNRFFYGKMAGVSNYRYLLGKKYSEEHLLKIRNKIKELAYKNKKSYNSTEVKKLIRNLKI